MKTYVIMSDYGSEGWEINGETDDFQDAVKLREFGLLIGRETVIFKPVKVIVTEGEVIL